LTEKEINEMYTFIKALIYEFESSHEKATLTGFTSWIDRRESFEKIQHRKVLQAKMLRRETGKKQDI